MPRDRLDEQRLGEPRRAGDEAVAAGESAMSICSTTSSWPTMTLMSCSTVCLSAAAELIGASTVFPVVEFEMVLGRQVQRVIQARV
jgi:hypothetical protein